MAANYGGLVARIIFQPVEETSRNLFAKLCAIETSHGTKRDNKDLVTATDAGAVNTKTAGKSDSDPVVPKRMRGLIQARDVLIRILHLYALLGAVACSLGPYIAPRMLTLVAGRKWSATAAGPVLGAYTFYIPLLALNGVTEAFVAAVATNSQLRQQTITMGFYFVGSAGAAYAFLRVMEMGATGLVWANCVNMMGRIIWGAWFTERFFNTGGVVRYPSPFANILLLTFEEIEFQVLKHTSGPGDCCCRRCRRSRCQGPVPTNSSARIRHD